MFLARPFTIFFLVMESVIGSHPDFENMDLPPDWTAYHNRDPPSPERRGVDRSLAVPFVPELVGAAAEFPHWSIPPAPPKKTEPPPVIRVPVQATPLEAVGLPKPLPKDRKNAETLLLEEYAQDLSSIDEKRNPRKVDNICDAEKSTEASREEACQFAKKIRVNRFAPDDVTRNNECIVEQANVMKAPNAAIKLDVLHCQNGLMIASGTRENCLFFLERDRNGVRPEYVKIMSHTCDNLVDVSSNSEKEGKKLDKPQSSASTSKQSSHGRRENSSPSIPSPNRLSKSIAECSSNPSQPENSSPNSARYSSINRQISSPTPARSSSPIAASVSIRSSSPIATHIPTGRSSPNLQIAQPSPARISSFDLPHPVSNLARSSSNLPNIPTTIHHKSSSHNLPPTSMQPSLNSPSREHLTFSPPRVSSPAYATSPSLSRFATLNPPQVPSPSLVGTNNSPGSEHITSSPAHVSSPTPIHSPAAAVDQYQVNSPSSRKNVRANTKKSENIPSKKIKSVDEKKVSSTSKIVEIVKKGKISTASSLSRNVEKYEMISEMEKVNKSESKKIEEMGPGKRRANRGKSRSRKFEDFEYDFDSDPSEDDGNHTKSKSKESSKKKITAKKDIVQNTSTFKSKKVEYSDDNIAFVMDPMNDPYEDDADFTKAARTKQKKGAGKNQVNKGRKSKSMKCQDSDEYSDPFDDSFEDDLSLTKSTAKGKQSIGPEKIKVNKVISKSKSKKHEDSDEDFDANSDPSDESFEDDPSFTKSTVKGKQTKGAEKIKVNKSVGRTKSKNNDPNKNDKEEDYKVSGVWKGGKFYKPGDVIPGMKKPGDKSKITTPTNTGSSAEKRKLDKEIKVDKGGRNQKAGKFEKLDILEEASPSEKPEISERRKSKIIPKPSISGDPDLTPSPPSSSDKNTEPGKSARPDDSYGDSDYQPSSSPSSYGISTSPNKMDKTSSSPESDEMLSSSPSSMSGGARGRAKPGRGRKRGGAAVTSAAKAPRGAAKAPRGRGTGRGRGRGRSSKVTTIESSDEEYTPQSSDEEYIPRRSPSDTIAKSRTPKMK